MAPIEEMSCLSKSGVQFAPPSSVFQTPPATAPKYQVFGSPGTPSIASARPPRNGPTCRHCIPEKSFGSICGAGVGDAPGDGAANTVPLNATRTKTKKKQRPREYMARKFQTYAHRSTANAQLIMPKPRMIRIFVGQPLPVASEGVLVSGVLHPLTIPSEVAILMCRFSPVRKVKRKGEMSANCGRRVVGLPNYPERHGTRPAQM